MKKLKVSKSKPVKFWPDAPRSKTGTRIPKQFDRRPEPKQFYTPAQKALLNSLLARFGEIYIVSSLGRTYLLLDHWQFTDCRTEMMIMRVKNGFGKPLFKGELAAECAYIYDLL